MAIQYPLPQRTVVRCDYSRGGFQEPEMTKIRPAIVVSPRLRHRPGLHAVVPLSTSEPEHDVPYVVRLEFDPVLPSFSAPVMWAKCDMVATVSFQRLDMFRTGRDQYGRRRYLTPRISEPDFQRVLAGIAAALGMTIA